MTQIEGFCVLKAGNAVVGWVRNPANPEERLGVEVRSENGFHSFVTADLFQPDLAPADRHCAFRCELPSDIIEDGVKIHVMVRGTNCQVRNSPLIMRKNKTVLDILLVNAMNMKSIMAKPDGLSVRCLLVDPIDTCNADCLYCPHPRTNTKIDLNDFSAFLEKIARPHIIQIGCAQEPTTDKRLARFFELIGASKNKPAVLRMITNGTLLDRHDASVFVNKGLSALQLSIDTADAGVNDALRVGTKLVKILANVRQFRKQFPKVKLMFSIVVSTPTVDKVSDLVLLGEDLGVCDYVFREVSDYSTNPRSPSYTAEMPRLLLPAGRFREMQSRLTERWPTGRFTFLSRVSLDSRRAMVRGERVPLLG